jgi:hypothetical protein
LHGYWEIPQKAIRNNAGMVPRENLEESVVRTGRDFPAGGNPCLSQGLTSIHASISCKYKKMRELLIFYLLFSVYLVSSLAIQCP